MKHIVRAAVLTILLLTPSASPLDAQEQAPGRPKLVVFVAVDQMRADYLVRYADLYQHGLKQLTEKGAWYTKAAYPYLNTITCAGHSTLGTGTFPYKHGMVLNAWFNRETGKMMTCTEDPSVKEVSFTDTPGIADSAKSVKQPSLAEMIHRNKGQVVTMSIKPRSAIGLAGHQADSVTWFDEHGNWETSTAYGKSLPAWVVAFAKANPVERDAGNYGNARCQPSATSTSMTGRAKPRSRAGRGPFRIHSDLPPTRASTPTGWCPRMRTTTSSRWPRPPSTR